MAITFAAAGAEASGANVNSLTLNAPSSPLSGDIWIAVGMSAPSRTYSMSGDWTQIVNNGDAEVGIALFWHRYAGSNPSFTFTMSGNDNAIGGIASFRGCKSSGSPVNAAGTITFTSGTTIAHGAITPSVAGCALLVANAQGDNTTRTALGGDYSVAFEDTAGGTQNCFTGTATSLALSYDLSVPASSTGTVNQTTSNGAAGHAQVLVALEPEPEGQPYYLHEGGIPFCADSNNGQGHTVWRKALGWRKTLGGLLTPPKPRILRPAFQ